MVWGAITWNGAWFATWQLPFWNASSNLPLGQAQGIVVDDQGRIYIGSQYYSRIQVYNISGQYLKGWFVSRNIGPFRLRLNSQGHLEVASRRADKIFTFDHTGYLISQTEGNEPYERFGRRNEYQYRDQGGNLYQIRQGWTFPHIVCNDITIIKTTWYQWLVKAPFPSGSFGTISAIIIIILRITAPKKMSEN